MQSEVAWTLIDALDRGVDKLLADLEKLKDEYLEQLGEKAKEKQAV